jgi:nitrogen fixation-related uncharacterized protein
VKFLLVFPTTIVAVVVGVIGDILLWDLADGRYEDSDTIIFGLHRVNGSAASWYGTASGVMVLVLVLVWVLVTTIAVWPKGRLIPSIHRVVDRIRNRRG